MNIHSYQVSVRKAEGNFIRRNAEELLVTRGEETRLTTRNLEMGEVYEFRVWCKVQRCLPFTFNTHQKEKKNGQKVSCSFQVRKGETIPATFCEGIRR